MKVSIATYGESVSNVFDFARKLLIAEVEDGVEISRCEVLLIEQQACRRLCQLKELEVDVLICGALSRNLGNMIMESGIKLLPYVTGEIEDVLRAYLEGKLVHPEFLMPGGWSGARKGFGRGRRGAGHGGSGRNRRGCR